MKVPFVDLRAQYFYEIYEFEKGLRAFEKEHNLPVSPSAIHHVKPAKEQIKIEKNSK